MKIGLIKPDSVNVNPWVGCLRDRGMEVVEDNIDASCDFIICASISQLGRLVPLQTKYPQIPIIHYNWDLYEWHKSQNYDWLTYGKSLQQSREIWCPSAEVILRTEEYYGLGRKCHIIKTFARLFDYDDVQDKRYIYNPMRAYFRDKNYGWAERACKELEIPLVESKHKLSQEDFEKTIAHCTFLLCEYYEASTGGLTLLEGHRLGKQVLVLFW